jgi:hypothetical protein
MAKPMQVRRPILVLAAALASAPSLVGVAGAQSSGSSSPPTFAVDPSWPSIPAGRVLGEVSSIAAARDGHIWVLHRPRPIDRKSMARAGAFGSDSAERAGWTSPTTSPSTRTGIAIPPRSSTTGALRSSPLAKVAIRLF